MTTVISCTTLLSTPHTCFYEDADTWTSTTAVLLAISDALLLLRPHLPRSEARLRILWLSCVAVQALRSFPTTLPCINPAVLSQYHADIASSLLAARRHVPSDATPRALPKKGEPEGKTVEESQ